MRWTSSLILSALVALATNVGRADTKTDTAVRRSVVRIIATQRFPNLLQPWKKQNPEEVSGSGVVIDGECILTNAHLVIYASQIYVAPYESSDRLNARVIRLAPGIDLAVLKLEDKDRGFFKARPPVPRAPSLPEVRDPVSLYGYPIGGASLAVTQGTVARILFGQYSSGELGLRIQIDAALNPGNSGGPALGKDRMIGLAAGFAAEGQNIGYLIPNEEIDEFLNARDDALNTGKPRIVDELQGLQNEALRNQLQVDRSTRGILVRAPDVADPSYPLKKGDVITRIGTYDLDNDGMIPVKENLRLAFPYIVSKLAHHDHVPVTLLRQGQTRVIDLPVVRNSRPLLRLLRGKYPSYFVYGPLVFSPATPSLVQILEGHLAQGSPLLMRWSDKVAFDDEELVVVTTMLPHKISKGYADPVGQVVRDVNGKRIRNLRHLVETLRDLTEAYVKFEFHEKYVEDLVFDRKEVLAAMDDILSDNNIGQQCSAELRKVWRPDK